MQQSQSVESHIETKSSERPVFIQRVCTPPESDKHVVDYIALYRYNLTDLEQKESFFLTMVGPPVL
jgi:hypothetical protein